MHDVHTEAGHLQITFHHDNETPLDFLLELLHSVFKKQLADALRFTEAISDEGQASCGSYPRDIAGELLETARQRIDAAGHPLRITSKTVVGDEERLDRRCKLCDALFGSNRLSLKGIMTVVCDDCMYEVTRRLPGPNSASTQ